LAKDRLDTVFEGFTDRLSPSETQQLGDIVGDRSPKNVSLRQHFVPKAKGVDGDLLPENWITGR